MITPIILLAILVVPFWLATIIFRDSEKSRFYGVLGLSLVFFFAGIGHFIKTHAMAQLLPPWVPLPILIIYVTGIIEFIVATGLLNPKSRKDFGWAAIVLFIVFLPANIYGAYSRVELGGHSWGLSYLLLRVPLQLIFIFWAYWFCVRHKR
ncbi:MAG: DoxX family protein [Thermodesulfobacteriota bacterium]